MPSTATIPALNKTTKSKAKATNSKKAVVVSEKDQKVSKIENVMKTIRVVMEDEIENSMTPDYKPLKNALKALNVYLEKRVAA